MSFLFRGRRPKDTDAPVDLDPAAVHASASNLQQIAFVGADASLTATLEVGGERVTDLLNRDELAAPFEDVLLVVPPSRPTDPRRRLHRPRHAIEVEVGPFEVAGTMHVPPGAQAAGYLARVNPRFVPVTNAVIRRHGGTPPEWYADVVLVNVSSMRHLTEEGSGTVAGQMIEEFETA
jgi:hypothetical protein